MSSIFVPELAKHEAEKIFPAMFKNAVKNLNNKQELKLKSNDEISNIVNREEEIWSKWVNLCEASRGNV
jgi:hypothetical protein